MASNGTSNATFDNSNINVKLEPSSESKTNANILNSDKYIKPNDNISTPISSDAGSDILPAFTKSQGTSKDRKAKIQRSRFGCKTCKRLKIKCNEEKPKCSYCSKNDFSCDYSITLTWGGRPYKDILKRKDRYSSPNVSKPHDRTRNKKSSGMIEFVVEDLSKSSKKDYKTPMITPLSLVNTDINPAITSEKIHTPDFVKARNERKSAFDCPPTIDSPNIFTSTYDQSVYIEPFNEDPNMDMTSENGESEEFKDKANEIPKIENLHEISDGIESLSNALNRILNGTHQLNLTNSDLFHNFVTSNFIESTKSLDVIQTSYTPGSSESIDNNLYMDDYSQDIAKIESFLPHDHSNLINEFLSPNFSSFLVPKKVSEIYDMEDEDEDEEPLDDECLTVSSDNVYNEMKTVPPTLMPLPEILLQVPFYRYLLHFWVDVAANNLVPAPSHIYKENPFKVLLPQMAMSIPSVLTTLLAFSAKARTSLSGDERYIPASVIDQLLSRSCAELLKSLKDKNEATSDGTLATILLLSCYEVFHCESFERHRVHTIGARQIISARRSPNLLESENHVVNRNTGIKSLPYKKDENDIAYFLMRWFAYIDVIGALSSTKGSHQYLTGYDSTNYDQISEINSSQDEGILDPKRDIDYLLGFDVKIFPQLAEIALLIRKTDAYFEQEPDANNIPIPIITEAMEVKEKFIKVFQDGESRRQKSLDELIDRKAFFKSLNNNNSPPNLKSLIQQDNILTCTNKIFCEMGLLNLYRRVLKIPRESSLIQKISSGIADILEENIESGSSAEVCTIFCLFCAACETMDNRKREFFYDRFVKMSEKGLVAAKKSFIIITRCWETGEDWVTASRTLNIDIALM